VLQIDFEALRTSRAAVIANLERRGIGTQVHFIPTVAHPYFRRRGPDPDDFPAAERFYARALTLPLYPAMTDDDVVRVIDAVGATLA
jgi:dTDP-4-amino-4,6-dideoxygalactose transaminase